MRVLWVTLLVVVADQLTKVWVKLAMTPQTSIPVLDDVFKITFTENPGMAFGLSLGSKLFLTVFSVAATALIAAYLWHVRRGPAGYRLSLALILGGALGNIVDRVFYGALWGECYPGTGARLLYGCVVDFIHLDVWRGVVSEAVPFLGGRYLAIFPIGNVADLAIIAGVAAIILFQRRFHRQAEALEAAGTPGAAAPVQTAAPSGAVAPPAPAGPTPGEDAAPSAGA
ncbi:MAG TPA: signal peptidase II [Rubricoccaceae bacterium]|jgi:signal peptidase II|nr:signal peptidase II [Rubricoccaceae bacterium]